MSISVKIKLLALTIILVCIALFTHYFLSISEYKHDKIAYVFDSALEGVRNENLMFNADIDSAVEKLDVALSHPLKRGFKLSRASKKILTNDKSLVSFSIVAFDQHKGRFQVTDRLKGSSNRIPDEKIIWLAGAAMQHKMYLYRNPKFPENWSLALVIAPKSGQRVVAVGQFNKSVFLDNFVSPQIQNFYLYDNDMNLMMQATDQPYKISDRVLKDIFSQIKGEKSSTFVREISTSKGTVLAASSAVSRGDFRVLALIPKDVALEAVKIISIKSILLVFLLVGLSIIISVIGANGLTKNLARLYNGVKEITKGNLETRVEVTSKDEVAVLAQGFNMMAERIQELMQETAEKARMQNELQTAQTVQSTLFPKGHFVDKNIEVFGFYEPASECGGDWYSYSIINNKAYFWIGDATGHGVSAALITSAAKSAASVIQTMPELSTDQILRLMNIAVAECSGGNVLMTFIVGCVDLKTGLLKFSNASHDSPYVFKRQEEYKRGDVKPILSNNGSRLGQDIDSQYEESEFQLEPGDRLVLYTDGITELANANQDQWGEGRFVRALVKSFNASKDISEIGKNLLEVAYQFKGDEILHDDVTFFMLEYKGSDNAIVN